MSNLSFDDISLTVERLNNNFDEELHSFVSWPSPKVQSPDWVPTLTNGIFLATSTYSENISFDQDIFTELSNIVFDEKYNKQLADYMICFRTEYFKTIINWPQKKIPKLFYYFDKEESIDIIRLTSESSDGNAMLYFSFEKNPKDSSFGLIWNDKKKKNYQTRSGNIFLNKKIDVIHEVIDFIIRVF